MKTHYHHIHPILLTGFITFASAVSTKKDTPPHQLLANLEAKIKKTIFNKYDESPITYILLSVETRFTISGSDPENQSGQSLEASTIYKNLTSLQPLASTLKSHR